MKFIVLPAAQSDLHQIDDWVTSNFGAAAAAKADAELYGAFDLLAQFQQLGKQRPEIAESRFRFYSVWPSWIIYEPGDPLLIHRVFPARTDIQNLTL